MAGQVGKLTLKAVIDGFEDVQGLGKALKDVSEKAKKTDKAFEITTRRIKEFGKATFKTNEGLKGQISAFEKLRGRTDFQGRAYKNLTGEINALNRELRERLGLEKQIQSSSGRRKGTITPGPGDAAFLATGFGSVKTNEDFARRQSALQGLLLQRTFNDLNEKQKDFLNQVELIQTGRKAGAFRLQDFKDNPEFKRVIEAINASYLTAESKFKGSGKEITGKVLKDLKSQTGALNETQLQALSIQDRSNIRSKGYLEVLTKINAEEAAKTQILGAQNTSAANQIAQMEAKKLITDKLISQQKSQAKSFLYQKDKGTFLDNVIGPKGTARFYDPEGKAHVGYGTQAFREMPGFAQRLMSIANMVGIKSPTYSMMQEELAGGYTKDFFKDRTATYFPKNVGEYRASDKKLQQAMFDFPFMGKKFPVEPFDPFGTGKAQAYPKTDRGITAELQNLQSLLPDLVRGSDEWVKVTEMVEEKNRELNDSIKKGNEALKKRREEIAKAVNPKVNQKLLPPAKKRFVSGDTGFSADQYGPQLETQAQLTKRLQETLRARDLNINSIVKHKSKLEEIRNTLKPTSEAFRSVSKSILEADKALSRINSNKFSGQNLRRTGQSILGAGFVGGPAGFLGAGLGAGFEALRPGGDMASGAITGGLVASQVLQPIASFGQNSAEYTAMIEKSNIALQAATRIEGDAIASKKAYAVALGTAASVTERFNVPQELAARGMTRLSAAVIGAGGNIHNAGIAFENISAAIKATGGSTEDTKAAVTAMVQIFSKGKVSAEELSGQLGERFPAAVTLFAEANNMTTQELQKGLKDGAIGLDKLWKFVLKLGDKYVDVAEKIGSASVEAGVRSQIAWNKVKLAVGEALQPIGADLQVIGAEILTNLVPALQLAARVLGAIGRAVSFTAKAVVENFDKIVVVLGTFGSTLIWVNRVALTQLIQTLSVKLGNALTGVIAKMGLAKIATLGFAGSIKAARVAVVAFTASLMANPIIAVATGLSIAATAAWHFGRKWQRTVKEIESGKMTISDAKIKVAELKKALEGETNEEVKARLDTQIAMYEAAIKARKEIIKKANLDEADSFEGKDGKDGSGKWQIIRDHVDELGKQGEHLQGVFVNAFQGMEDAMTQFILTGKMNFKEFARSILADLARMIAKQMLFNVLSGFINRITNPAAPIGMTQGNFMPSNPNFVGVGANLQSSSAQTNILPNLELKAMGDAFASNGIVPYRKGGVVNRPTMFKFGGSRLGVMGEAGPEAILPLKRGRGGKLGVAMQGGGGGTTTVNYTGPTLNFNGDEYVPRSAVGGIIDAAANQGARKGQTATLRSLQNDRSARSRIGM